MWGETVTFTAGTDKGSTSVTKSGITISMSTMSRDDDYRTYASSSMTVSSSVGNITQIEVTCTGSGTSNYGPGKFSGTGYTYSGTKGTWSGSETSVSLSASAQVRMTSIVVTYTPTSTVVTPSFSVAEGAVEKGTSLTLSTTTEGADIYYTTDGTTPTSSSNKYTGAITINSAVTIKAIAIKGSASSVVSSASYTIKKVEAPTFSVAEGNVLEGSTMELETTTTGATIYYTTDGTTPTSSSSEYSSAITINADVTIKAIAVKNNWDDSDVSSADYTVLTPIYGLTIDFEANDVLRYADWTFVNIKSATSTITAHGGTYYGNTDGKATASITTKAKIAYPGTFTCYISKESGNTTACNWKIQTSSDGSSWTDVAEKSASSMTKGNWVVFSADLTSYKNVYVRLSYGSNTAVRAVDDIVLTSYVPVTVTAAGYATFVSDYAIDYTSVTGLKAYKATISGENITFTKVTTVPAGEGVLIKADAGNYNIPVTTGVAAWAADDNAFVRGTGAAVASQDGSVYNYVLSKHNDEVGFYPASGKTVGSDKAYISTTIDAARLTIAFDDETTGISSALMNSEKVNGVYNLNGQRVNKAQKGLYIINGKKVIK